MHDLGDADFFHSVTGEGVSMKHFYEIIIVDITIIAIAMVLLAAFKVAEFYYRKKKCGEVKEKWKQDPFVVRDPLEVSDAIRYQIATAGETLRPGDMVTVGKDGKAFKSGGIVPGMKPGTDKVKSFMPPESRFGSHWSPEDFRKKQKTKRKKVKPK